MPAWRCLLVFGDCMWVYKFAVRGNLNTMLDIEAISGLSTYTLDGLSDLLGNNFCLLCGHAFEDWVLSYFFLHSQLPILVDSFDLSLKYVTSVHQGKLESRLATHFSPKCHLWSFSFIYLHHSLRLRLQALLLFTELTLLILSGVSRHRWWLLLLLALWTILPHRWLFVSNDDIFRYLILKSDIVKACILGFRVL